MRSIAPALVGLTLLIAPAATHAQARDGYAPVPGAPPPAAVPPAPPPAAAPPAPPVAGAVAPVSESMPSSAPTEEGGVAPEAGSEAAPVQAAVQPEAAPTPPQPAPSSSPLPFTGSDVGLRVLGGTLLLAAGAILRRHSRT